MGPGTWPRWPRDALYKQRTKLAGVDERVLLYLRRLSARHWTDTLAALRQTRHIQRNENGSCRIVELKTFYRIWQEKFTEVRIPAAQRQGKCEICSSCHERILSERDKLDRESVHLKYVKADRLGWNTTNTESAETGRRITLW
jgi:hypothetical protein